VRSAEGRPMTLCAGASERPTVLVTKYMRTTSCPHGSGGEIEVRQKPETVQADAQFFNLEVIEALRRAPVGGDCTPIDLP
jgi:hypothetical protein